MNNEPGQSLSLGAHKLQNRPADMTPDGLRNIAYEVFWGKKNQALIDHASVSNSQFTGNNRGRKMC